MLGNLVTKKLITYDIACQWSVHLVDRIKAFPPHLQIELPDDDISYSIPKLHFDSHKKIDHSKFSLNYKPGAARTDGEGIERRWWFVQPIAAATVGMGPGRRQSVLEDQWAYSNWRKYVRMRECPTLLGYVSRFNAHLAWTLKKRLATGLSEFADQESIFNALTESINSETISKWKSTVEAWENDMSLDDPYQIVHDGECSEQPETANDPSHRLTNILGPTQAQIRQSIAAEESKASIQESYVAVHDKTPSGFIAMGLDLETQQYVFDGLSLSSYSRYL